MRRLFFVEIWRSEFLWCLDARSRKLSELEAWSFRFKEQRINVPIVQAPIAWRGWIAYDRAYVAQS